MGALTVMPTVNPAKVVARVATNPVAKVGAHAVKAVTRDAAAVAAMVVAVSARAEPNASAWTQKANR